MNKPSPEKEKLLSMLTEIHDQLEELELVLEASFSDHRNNLNNEKLNKISASAQRLSIIEKDLEIFNSISSDAAAGSNPNHVTRALKLEMGF
jgi:hypothetical protein